MALATPRRFLHVPFLAQLSSIDIGKDIGS